MELDRVKDHQPINLESNKLCVANLTKFYNILKTCKIKSL